MGVSDYHSEFGRPEASEMGRNIFAANHLIVKEVS